MQLRDFGSRDVGGGRCTKCRTQVLAKNSLITGSSAGLALGRHMLAQELLAKRHERHALAMTGNRLAVGFAFGDRISAGRNLAEDIFCLPTGFIWREVTVAAKFIKRRVPSRPWPFGL